MKTVTIIRHAKSSWSDPELPDLMRPLNQRGKEASKIMGHHLASLRLKPDLIVSSPAVRAYHTAVNIAQIIGYRIKNIELDNRLYFNGADGILERLELVDNSLDHVFIFSHEPSCSDFCEMMTLCGVEKYVTGAVFSMKFEVDKWKDIKKERGEKVFYIEPKKLNRND